MNILKRRKCVDQGGDMHKHKLAQNIFETLAREWGEETVIAELFFFIPENTLENISFASRLAACVHAEHSETCRCLPEMQEWLVGSVNSELECQIASEHIPMGGRAELALVQRFAELAAIAV